MSDTLSDPRDPPRVVIDHRTGRRGPLRDWVAEFETVWAAPREQLDRLMALLDPEVVLMAPTRPPRSQGAAAGRAAFERAFRAMPDLRGTIHGWGASGDRLFVEMTFHATVGGRAVDWRNVDRFRFVDGSAVERIAHFDPNVVRRAFLGSPTGLLQLLRMRLGI